MTQTIRINDLSFDVDYHYSPPEKATDDYPGYPGEVEIINVWFGSYNITPIVNIDVIDNALRMES